jgi:hydroxyacylglutathione hydrolase
MLQDNEATVVHTIKVKYRHFINYCYLVIDPKTRDAIIVDPAWEMEKIQDIINSEQANLKSVLLTHHHKDHVNLADRVAQEYNVTVHMSETEIQRYGFTCSNLVPFQTSKDIDSGSLPVDPIHTPGHTKGAVCYLINNALFTGDTLFTEGCGLCFGPGADPSEMYDSLNQLKTNLSPDCRIYPGHSYGRQPGMSFKFLLKYNIYLSFLRREDFIAFRMREGQKGLMNFR